MVGVARFSKCKWGLRMPDGGGVYCWRCKKYKDEHYMLKPEVWDSIISRPRNGRVFKPSILLCISCVEHRLDRRLTHEDFALCRLNLDASDRRSKILRDRLRGFVYELPDSLFIKSRQAERARGITSG